MWGFIRKIGERREIVGGIDGDNGHGSRGYGPVGEGREFGLMCALWAQDSVGGVD